MSARWDHEELFVITKTYDLILWSCHQTGKFPGHHRFVLGERIERNGLVIWNDCYNSNPEAARSMIDVLRDTPAKRRIAVLGEMLELGSAAGELHREVGCYAARQGIDLLIGVRGNAHAMIDAAVGAGLPESAAYFFEEAARAGEFLRQMVQPGDALLVKGSRGVAVERALEKLGLGTGD